MRLRKIRFTAPALVLGLSSLLIFMVPSIASAAAPYTCTWTGTGGNSNFSTAANWSGCNSAAPVATDNDNLVFDNTSLSANATVNNDITNLSVGTITFSGSTSNEYTLTGNALTVTNGVTNTSSAQNYFELLLTVSGNQTFSPGGGITAGKWGSTSIVGGLAGSGNVTVDNTGFFQINDMSNYTGTVSSTNGGIELSYNGGTFTSSGGVTVSGTATLYLDNETRTDTAYNLPLSIGGSGSGNGITALSLEGFTGYTTTLAGTTTLTSNVQVTGSGTLDITGPLSGSYVLSVASGQGLTLQNNSSNNTSQTPGGTQQSAVQVTTIAAGDNQPTAGVAVSANQEIIIDGIRGTTDVYSGGLLKGTGTVGELNS